MRSETAGLWVTIARRVAAALALRQVNRTTATTRGSSVATASRRTLLRRLVTGVAGAVGALTAFRARPIEAMSRTNTFGTAGAATYGIVAIRGQATDPDLYLPTLTTEHGVIGMTDQTFTTPVGSSGILGLSSGRIGVLGMDQSGTGVRGHSNSGMGVLGDIPGTSAANAIAIYGLNNSSYTGPGPGAGGFGVYGLSAKGHGLVGATASPGGAAVVGATNGVAGAYAGAFYGPVVVGGAFTVFGGPKSAAVPHPDGSHRRLYCVESPESWFEDFGKARLDECGRATISIDSDFAAVTDLSDYHVFLTAYGIDSPLYITEQTPSGFVVNATDPVSRQANAPRVGGSFSWRVVAKRKDIEGPRFASVTIPLAPTCPDLPTSA